MLKNISRIGCLLLSLMMLGINGYAQTPNDAPQIVTSDLQRRQKVEDPKLKASFVVYDDDLVTEVKINDNLIPITPAKTVVVNVELTLKVGRNQVKVNVTDEAGNQREKIYLVAFGVELKEEPEEKTTFEIKSVVGLKYEIDSNPTNDVGLPFPVGDLELTGLIKDSEQPDVKTSANGVVVGKYDNYNVLGGASVSRYSKAQYQVSNSTVLFLGGGNKPPSVESGQLWNYLFLDINTGGKDFSQNHVLTYGYQDGREDGDGNTKHTFSGDYTLKGFADTTNGKGSQIALNWVYFNLDSAKQDDYRSKLSIGSVDDGTADSQHTYISHDNDWKNKWDSGVLFDIGFGYQYKQYSSAKPALPVGGETRVDLPIRLISLAIGWQFVPGWTAKYGFDYKLNLSNQSIYERQLHGVILQGSF